MDYPSGPSIITRVLTRGRQEGQNQRRKSDDERGRAARIGDTEIRCAFVVICYSSDREP